MNIVVLAGGNSTERDVSISSGEGVCSALRQKNHKAVLVDVYFGKESFGEELFPEVYDVKAEADSMREMSKLVEETGKTRKEFFGPNVLSICKAADIVFLALHGANGEDGKVQSVFELMGIPYTGTGYLSSAMAMDKGVTKAMFQMRGVSTPGGKAMKKKDRQDSLAALGMEFPVVVKTCCGGSSIGVYIVNNQEDYVKALDEAFEYENEVVIEEFIKGVEYTVAVVDGTAYPVVQIVPKEGFYDYENKYKPGAVKETCPAPISEELTKRLQEAAVDGYHALEMESYARLDFIVTKDEKIYCLEANTLPGMTPTSLIPQEAAVLGMDYPTLCEELIKVSQKKYA